jgi:hypothetical protein
LSRGLDAQVDDGAADFALLRYSLGTNGNKTLP